MQGEDHFQWQERILSSGRKGCFLVPGEDPFQWQERIHSSGRRGSILVTGEGLSCVISHFFLHDFQRAMSYCTELSTLQNSGFFRIQRQHYFLRINTCIPTRHMVLIVTIVLQVQYEVNTFQKTNKTSRCLCLKISTLVKAVFYTIIYPAIFSLNDSCKL